MVDGVPARVIKFKYEQMIEALERIRWWECGPEILRGLDLYAPGKIISQLEEKAANFEKLRLEKMIMDYARESVTYE